MFIFMVPSPPYKPHSRPLARMLLLGLPQPILMKVVSEYCITLTDSLPQLLHLALVCRQFYAVVQKLLHSHHDIRPQITTYITRFLHNVVSLRVKNECRGHPIIDNLVNSSMSNPYFSLRWLLYDPLPSIYMEKERTYFQSLYFSPLPLKYHWSIPCVRERAKKGLPSNKHANSVIAYIKLQLARKSRRVAKFLNSWYYNKWFDRAIADMLMPYCSFCFESISGSKLPDMYCTVCRTSDTYSHPPLHRPGEQFACATHMVPICKECLAMQERHRSLRFARHCPLSNPSCVSFLNGWQGCQCDCHIGTNERFEYMNISRKRRRYGV